MHTSDSSLIKKIQKGDKSAFEQLFKSHYAPLCDYAHRYIKNPQAAEDQVQEVFVKIWEIRKDWNPKGTIKAYLYTAVRNQSLNYLKHQKIVDQWKKEERKASRNTSNPLPSSEYAVNLQKLKKQVQEAIQQLPEKRREVFELSRNHGLTYKEIAKSLGISVKTVETQMSRSLRHLRNRLPQELN
jgi:RNA polymerase sigma-70 factor (ECF subfamily)